MEKKSKQKIEYEGDHYSIYTLDSDSRSPLISRDKGTQKSKVSLWKQIVDLNPELVLDIGANYGEFSVTIANKHKNILSFEANKEVFDCLECSINELSNANIKVFNLALGDKDSTSTLYVPKSSGNASLDLDSLTTKGEIRPQIVDERNILNYIADYKSFVAKIDIEGTEYKLLNKIKENEHLFDWYCVFFEFNKSTDTDKNKINVIENFLNEKKIKLVYKDDSKILNEGVFKFKRGNPIRTKPITDIIAFYNI